jgi:hypothetical protein
LSRFFPLSYTGSVEIGWVVEGSTRNRSRLMHLADWVCQILVISGTLAVTGSGKRQVSAVRCTPGLNDSQKSIGDEEPSDSSFS